MNFEDYFNDRGIGNVINKDKTISKNELEVVFDYFQKNNPKTFFEFGVNRGCSTRSFCEMKDFLESDMEIHCWDVKDKVKYADKTKFNFHIEDITGKEAETFDKYNPDIVFLDAHPYQLTKNLINECLKRKIDFMCHDVSYEIGHDVAKKRSKGWTRHCTRKNNCPWELYLLCELIDDSLWKSDKFENDELTVECTRDRFGISLTTFKR